MSGARRLIPLAGSILVLITFGIDLTQPVGYDGGSLYVIPIVLGLWASERYVTACTITSLTLTIVGYFLSPGDHWLLTAIFNRISASLVLTAAGVGVQSYRRAHARLDGAQRELESTHAELAEREERLGAILHTTIDAILRIDEHGILQSANAAAERIFGWPHGALVGQNVSVLASSPHREAHDGYLKRYLETGEAHMIGGGREMEAQRRDGSVFPVHVSVAEVRTGRERFFTGVVRDITVEKQAQAAREELITQLEQKNAELERFTYTVSHDLKSPLITIKGFAGSLERDARAGNFDQLADDVVRISRAADRMKELLDDLLALSRIGRVANPEEDVPLAEVVSAVCELLAGPIKTRGVEVVIVGDLPVVHGDRVRLREVVQNLIDNAVRFTGDQAAPRIEVGTLPDATLYVRDNGMGIDPAHLEKIFGLFERLDAHGSGTGIGLALVRRIVEVHGGHIRAESEGLGRGSTFYMTLPIADGTTDTQELGR